MQPLREWFTDKKVVEPQDVKKLPAGTKVYIHRAYGRRGDHTICAAQVVMLGKSRRLAVRDYRGDLRHEPIKTDGSRVYTLD